MPTRIVPDSNVQLGRRYSGLAGTIGYKLEGSVTQAFSTLNVVESDVPGDYHHDDGVHPPGVPVPAAFDGYIVWGDGADWFARQRVTPDDRYRRAREYGRVNRAADGSLTFLDADDGTTPVIKFGPKADGGRTVTKDPA
jgi:hypothetical protein